MNELSGVVNVLKPTEMTSHSVVNTLRRVFETKKVGHTGTLDPGAAGVLPVCIGRATKISEYLMDKNKTYYTHIVFGRATDTYDNYGNATETSEKIVDILSLENALSSFTGEIEQEIPAFSAKKLDGRKLYELARKGNIIDHLTKNVTVNTIEIINEISQNTFLLKIDCSMGTYIRSICHGIGKNIGVPSHMGALIRTKSGNFNIENSFTLDELFAMKENGSLQSAIISMAEALCNYPRIDVSTEYKTYIINGRKIPLDQARLQEDILAKNIYRCYCGNTFYGIASIDENLVRIEKLLNLNMG